MNNRPCYGCEKRTINCHSTCEDYIAFSKAIRERRAMEHKKRSEENDVYRYTKDMKEKCAMQRGKKYKS